MLYSALQIICPPFTFEVALFSDCANQFFKEKRIALSSLNDVASKQSYRSCHLPAFT